MDLTCSLFCRKQNLNAYLLLKKIIIVIVMQKQNIE